MIELHTGSFCDAVDSVEAATHLTHLLAGAEQARQLGLQVNAGHGIHLGNLPEILTIPHLDTLNIGHSIIARSIFVGLKNAVQEIITSMTPSS